MSGEAALARVDDAVNVLHGVVVLVPGRRTVGGDVRRRCLRTAVGVFTRRVALMDLRTSWTSPLIHQRRATAGPPGFTKRLHG